MSRLFDMSDPADKSLLDRMNADRAKAIMEVLDDPEAVEALRLLKAKGYTSAHIHGAYSSLLRKTKEGQSDD